MLTGPTVTIRVWSNQHKVRQIERALQPGPAQREVQPTQIAQRAAGRRASAWTNVVTAVCRMWNLHEDNDNGILARGVQVESGHRKFTPFGPRHFAVVSPLGALLVQRNVVFHPSLFRRHAPDDILGKTLLRYHGLRRDRRSLRRSESATGLLRPRFRR
ncbi:hypothetical protein HPB50_028627 [Hyalomma asiaticum]|nr:hypothetical protein HPB50_028627 [Hyalomma asiaticum]